MPICMKNALTFHRHERVQKTTRARAKNAKNRRKAPFICSACSPFNTAFAKRIQMPRNIVHWRLGCYSLEQFVSDSPQPVNLHEHQYNEGGKKNEIEEKCDRNNRNTFEKVSNYSNSYVRDLRLQIKWSHRPKTNDKRSVQVSTSRQVHGCEQWKSIKTYKMGGETRGKNEVKINSRMRQHFATEDENRNIFRTCDWFPIFSPLSAARLLCFICEIRFRHWVHILHKLYGAAHVRPISIISPMHRNVNAWDRTTKGEQNLIYFYRAPRITNVRRSS